MGRLNTALALLLTAVAVSAKGRPRAPCACHGQNCSEKAWQLMIKHGWTGTEVVDKVKHGKDLKATNLNRWFRNHREKTTKDAAARVQTEAERQVRDEARAELARINKGRLEAATRNQPAVEPVVSKSKKKPRRGTAAKGFRMHTNQLAGVEAKRQELAAVKDEALIRACHALHDGRLAYEQSQQRLRSNDPNAHRERVPQASAPSCAQAATTWAKAQCEERGLDYEALHFKMRTSRHPTACC
jgi:hypothetical protein